MFAQYRQLPPVSTHSRAEAAASAAEQRDAQMIVSTHSRAEAAATDNRNRHRYSFGVSTHSRAEAAAQMIDLIFVIR